MRKARLRPEFAHLYPGLIPGQWEPAARIAEVVLAQFLLQQIAETPSQDRALNEAHFEFRGGVEPPRPNIRRRAADQIDPAQ